MPHGTVQGLRLRGNFNNVLAHALGGCLGSRVPWDSLGIFGNALGAHLGIGRLWAGDGSVMDRMFDGEHVMGR